jgi:hypothetical protein
VVLAVPARGRAAAVAFVPTGKVASDFALSVVWTNYLLDLIPTTFSRRWRLGQSIR